jgi:Flp pilus assembly protein TadB
MIIEDLRRNVEHEKRIILDMGLIQAQLPMSDEHDRRLFSNSLISFKEQLNILNDAIPQILEGKVSGKEVEKEVEKVEKRGLRREDKKVFRKERKVEKNKNEKVVRMSYISPSAKEKRAITINKEDKKKFIQQLSLSEAGLSRLKKKGKAEERIIIKKPSKVARVSNLVFSKVSERIAPKFSSVKDDLKKSNSRFSIHTYVSIALFVSSFVFLFSLLVFGVLSFVSVAFLAWIWVPFFLLMMSLVSFYLYPSLEKGAVNKGITNELPFATIHMAAIAGANIEPTKIFKIIATSSEYPHFGKEIRKMLTQIDIYGYDLVNALKHASKQTSNKKLAELFTGLATNIVSGGSLESYLSKKSENLLMDYKLERQKYTSLAETFMDVYIAILITAPLVLMILMIVMNVTGFGIGISIPMLLILAVGGIVLVNVLFLIFLQFKQPKT